MKMHDDHNHNFMCDGGGGASNAGIRTESVNQVTGYPDCAE